MPLIKSINSDKEDLILTVLSELKLLGVKVPKHKKLRTEISKPEKSEPDSKCRIFGVHLNDQEWISDGDSFLPKFVALSTMYLRKYSCIEVGLFRKAGNVARQKKLRVILELGGNLEECEPNDVASLLKQWLRELPEPLIPLPIQDLLTRSVQLDPEEKGVTACLLTCLLLLPDHLHTLRHILKFLADIAFYKEENKMDVYNLALIMAPNIFSMNESAEKIKTSLVKLHTLIMKILIENCNKVGEIPAGISFQHVYLSSELDSSSEILDSTSNKSKKKCKGGPVQDIFSGIKKLVGQNGTPNSKSNASEHSSKTPSHSRSLSKRKADAEMRALSGINKKQARSLDALDNPSLNITPKKKDTPPNEAEKNASNHVRRKSLGALLRRKDRKRNKSCKPSHEVLQLERKPSECINEHENLNVQNSIPTAEKSIDSSAQVKVESQSNTFKKSFSDGYLPVNKTEFPTQSQVFLPSQRKRISSHKLRSQSLCYSQLGEASILEDDLKRWANEQRKLNHTIQSTSTKKALTPKLKLEDIFHEIDTKENIPYVDMTPQTDVKLKNGSNRVQNEREFKQKQIADLSTPKRRSPRLSSSGACVAKTDVLLLKKDNSNQLRDKSLKTIENDTCAGTNLGMRRQEAFISKCVKNNNKNLSLLKDSVLRSGSRCSNDFTPKKRDRTSFSSKSVRVPHNKRNTPEHKSMRRRTRHGSLMRGRPNSVNNGLQSSVPRRGFDASDISLNAPGFSSMNEQDTLRYPESRIAESPILQSLDLSLTTLIQNFSLISPGDFASTVTDVEMHSRKNTPIFKQKVSPIDFEDKQVPPVPIQSESDAVVSVKNEDATPLLKKRKRLTSKSDSKITPIKKDSRPKRLKSFSCDKMKPKQGVLEHSLNLSSNSSIEKLKSPLSLSQHSLNLTLENGVMNDSCFKTPIIKPNSLETETWMNSSTFLSGLSPPQEEVFNKRESIAMILKNNTGHVQAKVDLYDNNKLKCTSSTKKDVQSTSMLYTPQKCYSASKKGKVSSSRKFYSETKNQSSSVKSRVKFQKSPLPPPPKFILTDFNTPSPKLTQPLKEVTNLTPRIEEAKDSPKKPEISTSPAKYLNSPLHLKKMTPKSEVRAKRLTRNSFSGGTPYKLSKRVTRSESSPACRRTVVVTKD